jgi:uncharacterized protein YaiL (DUF2058 family)
VLDLKAKLAAAGVVTKEQVDKFDEAQAQARNKKEQDQARAAERRASREKPNNKRPNNKRPINKQRPNKRAQDKHSSGVDVGTLKTLNRGDAYARIRKIVDHSRLDDKERTIPKPDDQIFNFVTSTGKVSRLYLTEATVKTLSDGKSGISSFMSHHGLSHCVLPKEVALALAEVFPLWLRHLQGHPAAGQIEEPEAPALAKSDPGNSA